jgi:transcription antitermination factor NusG
MLNNNETNSSKQSSKNNQNNHENTSLVAPAKVGQDVILTSGSFAGTIVKVIQINNDKHTLKVEVNFLGRVNYFDVPFSDVKLAK